MDLQIEASVSAHRRDFSSPAAFPPHQPQQFESHNNIQHYSPSPPPVVDGTAKRRALESAPSSPAPGPGSLPTSTSLAAPPAVKSHKRRRTANNVPTDLVDPSNPDSNTTKKMFVCKGYGNCKMAFSRSEHLARHVRYVFVPFRLCALIDGVDSLPLPFTANTPAKGHFSVIAAETSRVWTTSGSMYDSCSSQGAMRYFLLTAWLYRLRQSTLTHPRRTLR